VRRCGWDRIHIEKLLNVLRLLLNALRLRCAGQHALCGEELRTQWVERQALLLREKERERTRREECKNRTREKKNRGKKDENNT
jgi:hypothetical protein